MPNQDPNAKTPNEGNFIPETLVNGHYHSEIGEYADVLCCRCAHKYKSGGWDDKPEMNVVRLTGLQRPFCKCPKCGFVTLMMAITTEAAEAVMVILGQGRMTDKINWDSLPVFGAGLYEKPKYVGPDEEPTFPLLPDDGTQVP